MNCLIVGRDNSNSDESKHKEISDQNFWRTFEGLLKSLMKNEGLWKELESFRKEVALEN